MSYGLVVLCLAIAYSAKLYFEPVPAGATIGRSGRIVSLSLLAFVVVYLVALMLGGLVAGLPATLRSLSFH